ncbi:hypothetical protein MUG91_G565n4 [Manis pentadactyla]|nr:hypothetical protein MUG91_G565n4 [Manis pentadactyla]
MARLSFRFAAARQALKLMATFRDISITEELGSWSDVAGSARCWNRVMGECEIQFQDYSEAIGIHGDFWSFRPQVRWGDGQIELHVACGMTDIEADGVGSETLALRKELATWSDVTGSARCWNRFMGECEIQFQDYSEAIVVSMVILEFQATETLALRKELGSWSDVTGVQDVGTGLWLRCLIRSMGEIGLQLDSDPSTMSKSHG